MAISVFNVQRLTETTVYSRMRVGFLRWVYSRSHISRLYTPADYTLHSGVSSVHFFSPHCSCLARCCCSEFSLPYWVFCSSIETVIVFWIALSNRICSLSWRLMDVFCSAVPFHIRNVIFLSGTILHISGTPLYKISSCILTSLLYGILSCSI